MYPPNGHALQHIRTGDAVEKLIQNKQFFVSKAFFIVCLNQEQM